VVRPVHNALADRTGILGDLLSLVELLEESSDSTQDQGAKAEALLQRLPGIDAKHANTCLTRALTWANNLARE
jgi:c-di-GMP-related signal transduction protein